MWVWLATSTCGRANSRRATRRLAVRAGEQRQGIAGDQADRNRQVRVGLDRCSAMTSAAVSWRAAVLLDLGEVVPAVAVDVAEIDAPPGEGGHVRDGKRSSPKPRREEQERIDDPARAIRGRLVEMVKS